MSSAPTPPDVRTGLSCGKTGSINLVRLLLTIFIFSQAALARAGDFDYTSSGSEITITGYTGAGGSVTIPGMIDGLPVTRVGDFAFYCLSQITSIEIPSGVVSIGKSAFATCGNLTTVTLPSTVTSIDDRAFYYVAKLINVNLPGGLLGLGNEVFSDCPALATITIPASVTSMGTGMFKRCKGLTSATVYANVADIGLNTFEGCTGLSSVVLPASLSGIPNYLLYGCSKLTSVTIPAGVTTIGNGAFDGCSLLSAITIPAAVTIIGDYAFSNCYSLADLNVPGGVHTLGSQAFASCLKLTSVHFPSGLTEIGNSAFFNCQKLVDLSLPSSLIRIDHSAFLSCSSLVNVTIPAGVTFVGESAFARCTSGLNFFVEEGNSNYCSLEGVLYDKAVTRLLAYPGARTGSFTVPDGVTTIDPLSFMSCASLTEIFLPAGVKTISESAFAYCPLLVNLNLPSSVSWIGPSAFFSCKKLAVARFRGDAPSTGNSPFDYAAAGFTIFYQQGATGFSSPLWRGYPAVELSASQEISLNGPLGGILTDGNSALDFGYLLPGASQSQIITISNAGALPLAGIAVGIDGPAAAEFVVGGPTTSVLAPGTSTTFTVTFTAGASDLRNATLRVLSDDADESPFDLQLSGFCTPTPVPEVTVFQSANGLLFQDGVSVMNPGTAEVGTVVVAGLTIRNTGTGNMHGIAITLDGTNVADYSFTATPPAVLVPGASFSCIVSFSPKALGTRTAELHITSDDPDENPFDLMLSGLAKPPPSPEIAVESSTADQLADGVSVITFEPVPVGSTSIARSFTIRNLGNATLRYISLSKDGANPSDFVVTDLMKTSLVGGESTIFNVRFTPSGTGTRTAALHIYSNDADESPFDIQLSVSTPGLQPEIGVILSDSTPLTDGNAGISMGAVELEDSKSRVLTIANTGNAALTNIAISVDGGHAADFVVSGPASSNLVSGGQVNFTVNFIPGALGERSARLHIASNDSDENPFDIDLLGTGVPARLSEIVVESPSGDDLEDSISAVSLGSMTLGSTLARNFTIRNTGDADLLGISISVDGPGSKYFKRVPPPLDVLPPGGSTTFSVQFQPRTAGSFSATLHIQTNDPDESPFDIPVSATALAPPPAPAEIDVQQPAGKSLKSGASLVSFNSVKLKSSATRIFVIRNLGETNLNVASLTSSGPQAKEFLVTPLAGSVLAPGASLKFKVTFTPAAKGLRKAVLQIKNSDANEASFKLDLTGSGSVQLVSAPEFAVSGFPFSVPKTTITREAVDGLGYLTITIGKRPGTALEAPLVEVSSNLVDWYSGPRHTTVIYDGPRTMIVRDNTPDRPEKQRYIRNKPVPNGSSPGFTGP